MQTEILKLVYDYSINGILADPDFIETLIEIVTNTREQKEYVKAVIFSNQIRIIKRNKEVTNIHAGYNRDTGCFTVYFEAIKKLIQELAVYDYLFSNFEQIFYRNLAIMQIILHDLEHVNQYYKIDLDEPDLETRLLKMSLCFRTALKRKKYVKYYHQNPAERLAEINSFKMVIKILEPIENLIPNLFQLYQALFANALLKGYSYSADCSLILAPTLEYLKAFACFKKQKDSELEKEVANKYDLNQRMVLGLPISDIEFRSQREIGYKYFEIGLKENGEKKLT